MAEGANHGRWSGVAPGSSDLTQYYGLFFEEAGENLADMASMLVDIDVAAVADEALHAIVRLAHAIGRGAARFGFSDVVEFTHEIVALLDRLRSNELTLDHDMVDLLLHAADALRLKLARHEGTTHSGPDTARLVARIKDLAAGQVAHSEGNGRRRLRVRIGPLDHPAAADPIAELFRDVPSLGTLEPLDAGNARADGCRTFKVTTAATDDELIELFSFHVARDRVAIAPFDTAARPLASTTGGVARWE